MAAVLCTGGLLHNPPVPATVMALVTMGGITRERPVCDHCLTILRHIHHTRPLPSTPPDVR